MANTEQRIQVNDQGQVNTGEVLNINNNYYGRSQGNSTEGNSGIGNFFSKNLVKAAFNNYMGVNRTHISNAYRKCRFVRLILHDDPQDPFGSLREDFKLYFGSQDVRERSKVYEYLSVFVEKDGRWDSLGTKEILANESVIVTKAGDVVLQEYGGNLWRDRLGNYHKPRLS